MVKWSARTFEKNAWKPKLLTSYIPKYKNARTADRDAKLTVVMMIFLYWRNKMRFPARRCDGKVADHTLCTGTGAKPRQGKCHADSKWRVTRTVTVDIYRAQGVHESRDVVIRFQVGVLVLLFEWWWSILHQYIRNKNPFL